MERFDHGGNLFLMSKNRWKKGEYPTYQTPRVYPVLRKWAKDLRHCSIFHHSLKLNELGCSWEGSVGYFSSVLMWMLYRRIHLHPVISLVHWICRHSK